MIFFFSKNPCRKCILRPICDKKDRECIQLRKYRRDKALREILSYPVRDFIADLKVAMIFVIIVFVLFWLLDLHKGERHIDQKTSKVFVSMLESNCRGAKHPSQFF